MPIHTQTFTVTVSASIMPPMTEQELHDAVSRLAHEKEREHGMGALGVHVREVLGAGEYPDPEPYWGSM